jgi:hypothetical protein
MYLVRLLRETEPTRCIWLYSRRYIEVWLTWLWRLRSFQMVAEKVKRLT